MDYRWRAHLDTGLVVDEYSHDGTHRPLSPYRDALVMLELVPAARDYPTIRVPVSQWEAVIIWRDVNSETGEVLVQAAGIERECDGRTYRALIHVTPDGTVTPVLETT